MTSSEPSMDTGDSSSCCEQAVRKLWDYMDAELTPLDQQTVDAHLANCTECSGHYVFERRFLAAIHAAQRAYVDAHAEPAVDANVDADAAYVQALRAKVLVTLREAGAFRSRDRSE